MTSSYPNRVTGGFPSRVAGVLLGLVGLFVLTGCVGMPVAGPVVEADVPATGDDQPSSAYQPAGPVPGASAGEIVLGFLEAMKAVPVRTTIAADFLTSDARKRWHPSESTLTYGGLGVPTGGEQVTLVARDVDAYDRSGRWVRSTSGSAQTLTFDLVRTAGEWRIDRAPDALVVPRAWFTEQYTTASLYFLDPTARVVVPEPVYVPDGTQKATSLVRGLLAGPPEELVDVVRTAVPGSARLEGAVVPVDETGTAEVSLTGDEQGLPDGVGKALSAQLAWTLRQVPEVRQVRVRWNGELARFVGNASELSVLDDDLTPWGDDVSDEVFGLVRGKLDRGLPGDDERTTGAFGVQSRGLREASVSWDGQRAVAVSRQGTEILRADVDAPPTAGFGGPIETVATTDGEFHALSQDAADRVWALERRDGRDLVHVLTPAGESDDEAPDGPADATVEIPTLTPRDQIRRMAVSPDATRLVLVVRTAGQDRVLVSRLAADPVTGRFRAQTPFPVAPRLPTEGRVLDVAWGPANSLGVLSQVPDGLSETVLVAIDGSRRTFMDPVTLRLRVGDRGLVMSPASSSGVEIFTGRVFRDLRDSSQVFPDLPEGVTDVFRVG